MKTWISFLLPEDEYKEKKILHFFAEGAILLFLALIVSLICSRFINFDTETILFLHIALFAVYVLADMSCPELNSPLSQRNGTGVQERTESHCH